MIKKYLIASLILFGCLTSCDKGFDEMNTNPNALIAVEPSYQLNYAILNSAPGLNQIQGGTSIVKQQMRIFTGVGANGNFNVDARETSSSNWTNGYNNIRNLVDVIRNTKDLPEKSNLYNMARIWKAYCFMIITDSYGDVPYTEAGLGFLEGVTNPGYDSQQSIYTDILNELDMASAALDASKLLATSDILYGGSITQWKRLGYSLLLRAAMRLSKVDEATAKKYVAKAVAGGLMKSNNDNAEIRHTANFPSGIGGSLNGGQAHYVYLVADFVDYLQKNNDPRLASIAVRYTTAKSAGDQKENNADRSPADQIGIPMGYDNNSIIPIAAAAGLPSFMAYSQLDRTRMANPQAPGFLVTYAQTELLLAEAAFRGWASGNAAALFEAGIRADMERYSEYGANTTISNSDIDMYVQAHQLTTGHELEDINTQYWVASYLNGPEAWANFRRSGLPVLTPNPLHGDLGSNENFMRRFGYPESELNVNKAHVDEAVQRQGPDRIDTRVWWDKK